MEKLRVNGEKASGRKRFDMEAFIVGEHLEF